MSDTTLIVTQDTASTLIVEGGVPGLAGAISVDAPVDGNKYARSSGAWVQQTADQVAFTPAGGVTATDVQAAIVEVSDFTRGTLDQSLVTGQEVSITLNQAVTAPVIGVTKEVPNLGIDNENWDIVLDDTRFDRQDTALSTTLTPSATSGQITLTLGSGSFAAADVGKRIEGNGGVCYLKTAGGAAIVTTAFTDTSAIASGSWQMYAAEFVADGVRVTQASETYLINSLSYDTKTLSTATQTSTPQAIFFGDSDTKVYCADNGGSVYQYNLSTANDIGTGSYASVSYNPAEMTGIEGLYFKPDGTKMYLATSDNDTVYQYTLSTAWLVSTASYDSKSFSYNSEHSNISGLHISADGTKMYQLDVTSDNIFQYTLSTAWDISTASYDSKSFSVTTQATNPRGLEVSADGTKFIITDSSNLLIYQYTMSTAFDISTASYDSVTYDVSAGEGLTLSNGLAYNSDGTKLLVQDRTAETLYQYTTGSSVAPTSQYIPVFTNALGRINTTYWTDINSLTVTETLNSQTIYYAFSDDARTTWKIAQAAGERNIVRLNGGSWEYNSNVTYASETWSAATTNTEYDALAESMTVAQNRLTGTEINALSDAQCPTLDDSLDLSIILYTTDDTQIPISDGMVINYDASSSQEVAIQGTDFSISAPDTTTVIFRALIDGNFKARIL